MTRIKANLKIDWAHYKAAKFACENWHYSKVMPAGKTAKIGVWESSLFVGCVIFSHGANNNAAKSFGLTQQRACELSRVALRGHVAPVSRILSICLKLLKRRFSGIDLVFSYADKTNQGHHGGIYQANGWLYLGERTTSSKGAYYRILGKKIHGRSARSKYGSEKNFPGKWEHCPAETKHLYVKILNESYRLKFNQAKYPKRVLSKEIVASGFHSEGGGENPTNTLQTKRINT